MVYSPEQVKLKYVVLFNMGGDRRWEHNYEVDTEEVAEVDTTPTAEGEPAKCLGLDAPARVIRFNRWRHFTAPWSRQVPRLPLAASSRSETPQTKWASAFIVFFCLSTSFNKQHM